MNFDENLAKALQEFSIQVKKSESEKSDFIENPTNKVVSFLKNKGIEIPDMFHSHAIHEGNPLPKEPDYATRERYIYIFRKSGIFEFKVVPGKPDGDDSIMVEGLRSCNCCICNAVEV